MNNTDISPIFVIGTPRSGTTLTAKILGSHSTVFMPGETHFFDDVYSRRVELGEPGASEGAQNIANRMFSIYGRYNEPYDQERINNLYTEESLSKQIHESCSDYETVLTHFMSTQMNLYSKRIWGNNAPRDLFNVREISEFYPDAKIIICVRDPRDFIGSYKGKWRATADEEVERLKKLYHPVVTSYLWKANMKQLPLVSKLFPEKNIYTLKYEELVTSPEAKVAELCEYIGIGYEGAMLDVNFSNSSGGGDNNQIFTSSIGRWQDRVTNEEAWIAQIICSSEMHILGYGYEKLKVNIFKIFSFYLNAPFALWRGLQANKHKRGPLIPYILKRFSSTIAKG